MSKSETATKTRQSINSSEFVQAWVDAHATDGTLKDVCEAMGLTSSGASAKAASLRAKGVKLPILKKASRTSQDDVDALNKLIKNGK